MAPQEKKRVTNEQKLKQLERNIARMAEHFAAAELTDSLHNLRRKYEKNDKSILKLKDAYKPVHDALALLPSSSTLSNQTLGREAPTEDTVKMIAHFCSNAFAFAETVSWEDLLTQDLTFPSLLKTGQWTPYKGVYRCFYFHPDYSDEEQDNRSRDFHGGLLKLWEKGNKLHAFFVTGIRRDTYFHDLQNILETTPDDELFHKCKQYSDSRPDGEIRLVTYHGRVDTSLEDHFHMSLRRHNHTNTVFILLRRRENTAQSNYTGGIALLNLCRSNNVISFPMAVVRPNLTLSGDRAFLEQYLKAAHIGPTGTKIIEDQENRMNQRMLERVRDRMN